jgi:uncharacterized protein YebE (UPF0316 family)
MALDVLLNSPWYTYLAIPLLIFLARILDVSMGTIRVIFITRGFSKTAPLIAFFEILIWLAAARQIFTDLSNPFMYIAYAGGFAVGTYVGIYLDERISMGKAMIRVIVKKDANKMFEKLKKSKFTYTAMGADGPYEKVQLIMAVMDRKDIPKVIKIVKDVNPRAFYSIEDVRFAYEAPLPRDRKKDLISFREKKGK